MDDTIQITRPENLPVPFLELETICLADLTKEQRAEFVSKCCPRTKKHIEETEASGWYDQCHKTDRCKQMREEKELLTQTLQERNQILESRLAKLEALLEKNGLF
jgi:polyhydroxyalkanoate synthesis regulator phasin